MFKQVDMMNAKTSFHTQRPQYDSIDYEEFNRIDGQSA